VLRVNEITLYMINLYMRTFVDLMSL